MAEASDEVDDQTELLDLRMLDRLPLSEKWALVGTRRPESEEAIRSMLAWPPPANTSSIIHSVRLNRSSLLSTGEVPRKTDEAELAPISTPSLGGGATTKRSIKFEAASPVRYFNPSDVASSLRAGGVVGGLLGDPEQDPLARVASGLDRVSGRAAAAGAEGSRPVAAGTDGGRPSAAGVDSGRPGGSVPNRRAGKRQAARGILRSSGSESTSRNTLPLDFRRSPSPLFVDAFPMECPGNVREVDRQALASRGSMSGEDVTPLPSRLSSPLAAQAPSLAATMGAAALGATGPREQSPPTRAQSAGGTGPGSIPGSAPRAQSAGGPGQLGEARAGSLPSDARRWTPSNPAAERRVLHEERNSRCALAGKLVSEGRARRRHARSRGEVLSEFKLWCNSTHGSAEEAWKALGFPEHGVVRPAAFVSALSGCNYAAGDLGAKAVFFFFDVDSKGEIEFADVQSVLDQIVLTIAGKTKPRDPQTVPASLQEAVEQAGMDIVEASAVGASKGDKNSAKVQAERAKILKRLREQDPPIGQFLGFLFTAFGTLRLAFQYMDMNGSGLITRSEFKDTIKKLVSKAGVKALDEHAEGLYTAFVGSAEAATLTVATISSRLFDNGSTCVCDDPLLARFGKFMLEALQSFRGAQSMGGVSSIAKEIEFLFGVKSEKTPISRSDFKGMITRLKYLDWHIADLFARLDKDGSGNLTIAEFTAFLVEDAHPVRKAARALTPLGSPARVKALQGGHTSVAGSAKLAHFSKVSSATGTDTDEPEQQQQKQRQQRTQPMPPGAIMHMPRPTDNLVRIRRGLQRKALAPSGSRTRGGAGRNGGGTPTPMANSNCPGVPLAAPEKARVYAKLAEVLRPSASAPCFLELPPPATVNSLALEGFDVRLPSAQNAGAAHED